MGSGLDLASYSARFSLVLCKVCAHDSCDILKPIGEHYRESVLLVRKPGIFEEKGGEL